MPASSCGVLYKGYGKLTINDTVWCRLTLAILSVFTLWVSATDKRVLLTKWVAQAWEEVSSNKDTIVRSFKKCGISLAIDGSQDSEINIRELSTCNVEDSEDETSTDKDPFEDSADEMSTDVDPVEDRTISQPQTPAFLKPPHVQKISLVCVCVCMWRGWGLR